MQHKAYCLAQVNTSTKLRSTKKREHAHEKNIRKVHKIETLRGVGQWGWNNDQPRWLEAKIKNFVY